MCLCGNLGLLKESGQYSTLASCATINLFCLGRRHTQFGRYMNIK